MSLKNLWKPNIINVISAILGTPRDSSGRKNNTFLLFVLSFFVLSLVLIGSVFYRTARYRVELFCPPVVSVRQVTRKSGISVKKRVKKTVSSSSSTTLVNRSNNPKKTEINLVCGKTQITINATLQPPAPLPSAFYWVALLMFLFLGVLYSIIRHPVTQEWFIEILYAWKGVPRDKGAPVDMPTEIGATRPPPPPQGLTEEDLR